MVYANPLAVSWQLSRSHIMTPEASALFFLAAAVAIYFVPLFVAVRRGSKRANAIAALNVLLGWTLLGWVIALVWALADDKHET